MALEGSEFGLLQTGRDRKELRPTAKKSQALRRQRITHAGVGLVVFGCGLVVFAVGLIGAEYLAYAGHARTRVAHAAPTARRPGLQPS